jgi:hypothetical protein
MAKKPPRRDFCRPGGAYHEAARGGVDFRKNSGKTGVWKVGLGSGAGRVR